MIRPSQAVLEDDERSASLDYTFSSTKDPHLSPLDIDLDECDRKVRWDEIVEALSLHRDDVNLLELRGIRPAPQATIGGICDYMLEADSACRS
jgi:hypothetical protein